MNLRNRVKELRRVRASELAANERNWRVHPPKQRHALSDFLQQVGFADAVLAREREDGKLELIDGHLRVELMKDQEVPVLILDVSESEANTLLATLDPLTQMADLDRGALDALMQQNAERSAAIELLEQDLSRQAGLYQETEQPGESSSAEVDVEEFKFSLRCEDCGFEFNA